MLEVDLLVVGSGAGGLTSAFTAADAGLNVLVVEKSARFGGTSATSGGCIWIPNSTIAAESGHPDDPDEALGYLRALVGDSVATSKLQAYVDNAPRMLDYLCGRSEAKFVPIVYADYHMDVRGARQGYRTHEPAPFMAARLGDDFRALESPHPVMLTLGRLTWTMPEAKLLVTMAPGAASLLLKTFARYLIDWPWRLKSKRSRRLTNGNALVAALKVSLNKLGVAVRLGAAMRSLTTAGGRVTGAVVEFNGVMQTVAARRGVIIATGGFDHDLDLRRQHLSPRLGRWSAAITTNTGDGLKAAIEVGAATDLLNSAWWTPGLILKGEDRARPLFVERALPSSVIVDRQGKRFMNEAASYHVTGGEMLRENDGVRATIPSWFIFDAYYRSRYMAGPILPGKPAMDRFIPDAAREILRRADSLPELAKLIGVNGQTLAATVERFNGFCEKGGDEDFGRGASSYDHHYGDPAVKPNPNLGPIRQAPFYALPVHPCDLGSNGGLLTDEHACVLGHDGRPIAGLYAVGNASASVMGRSYPGAGATLGPAMTFGWLAARHAVNNRS